MDSKDLNDLINLVKRRKSFIVSYISAQRNTYMLRGVHPDVIQNELVNFFKIADSISLCDCKKEWDRLIYKILQKEPLYKNIFDKNSVLLGYSYKVAQTGSLTDYPNSGETNLHACAYGEGLFVCVTDSNVLYILSINENSDPTNWIFKRKQMPDAANVKCGTICYGNGYFVITLLGYLGQYSYYLKASDLIDGY